MVSRRNFHTALVTCLSMTVLTATSASLAAQTNAEKNSPTIKVLGFIDLYKTSSQEVANRLKQMGCWYSRSNEVGADSPMFIVESGCFDLPGAPSAEIRFVGDKQKDFAFFVKLYYNKGLGKSAQFADYYDPLVRKYGRPVEEERAFVGNQFARFQVGGSTIVLEDKHMSFEGTVMYLSNAAYNYMQALKRQQIQENKKQTEDLL